METQETFPILLLFPCHQFFPKQSNMLFPAYPLPASKTLPSDALFNPHILYSISFLISGRSQWTQVVLHPFQGQTHICKRGALREKKLRDYLGIFTKWQIHLLLLGAPCSKQLCFSENREILGQFPYDPAILFLVLP